MSTKRNIAYPADFIFPRVLYSYTVPQDSDFFGAKGHVWRPCIRRMTYQGYLANPQWASGGIGADGFDLNITTKAQCERWKRRALLFVSLTTIPAFIGCIWKNVLPIILRQITNSLLSIQGYNAKIK